MLGEKTVLMCVCVCVCMCGAGGESGSADTVRDPRGFAVKFYTDDGNWDLVGNNTPIFFIRDPILVSIAPFYNNWQSTRNTNVHGIAVYLLQ